MSMYLSNTDIGPTGVEPGEFIEGPLVPDADRAMATRSEPITDEAAVLPAD